MISLLSIGTNYRGESAELPDPELDCLNVAEALEPYCAHAKALLGKQATRRGILSAVRKFLATLKQNDLGILYFSGHGTSNKSRRREAIVTHGLELIYDFEMHNALEVREYGSMLVAIADCCHSGGLPRGKTRDLGQRRTIPLTHCFKHQAVKPPRSPRTPNSIFTACRQNELAYSTGQGGAFTLAFLNAFSRRGPSTTLPALYNRITKLLPSRQWSQHPQLKIDAALENRTLRSFMEAT